MLTEPKFRTEQIECFKDQGFVIFPKAFNAVEAQTIHDWAVELAEAPEEPDRHWVYHETSLVDKNLSLINRIENMTPFHADFEDWLAACSSQLANSWGKKPFCSRIRLTLRCPVEAASNLTRTLRPAGRTTPVILLA